MLTEINGPAEDRKFQVVKGLTILSVMLTEINGPADEEKFQVVRGFTIL
jgi:hypothetical protein